MRAVVVLASVTLVFAQTKLPSPVNRKVDFEKDVQPILAQKCQACHGAEAQQSGLRLDRRQPAFRGGDYGPVILAGDSAHSKLILRVANGDGGLQMPPTGPLSEEEVGILRAWIDQGADWRIQVEDEAPPRPVDPKLTELLSAVRNRNVQRTQELLTATPSLIKAADHAGSTLLHHAAGFGDLATMKLLLAKGSDPNAANRRKSTPLFWALHDEAKVRLLIEHGAKVNVKSIDGRSPLYQAATMPAGLGVVRMLLDKGADPNAATLAGAMPLMVAARSSIETMRLLIDKGANVNAKSAAGATALMAAASTGKSERVRFLLAKGADAKVRTRRNETALADAGTAGDEATIALLLQHGAEVNVQDQRGYSPLLYAAGSDTVPAEAVKMLLAKGADRGIKGDDETVAMLAAKRGDTEVARLLGVPAKATNTSTAGGNSSQRSLPEAVGAAFGPLEKQSHNFIRIGGCNSCHAQDLPSAAAAITRDRGLPAPAKIPQLPQSMTGQTPSRIIDLVVIATAGLGWEMFDLATNHAPADEYTDATVWYLKAMQTPEGHWSANESRRPPMSSGEYQATALAIYSLKAYGRPAEQAEDAKAIARAAAWLEAAKPGNTQDRAFQLLGLAWAGAKPASINASARALIAAQRLDGSWSQLPTMDSDAYATGQALYALNAGGISATHAAYAGGVRYLLRTQAADGTWHVKSRSIWLQPYFDSGFPYGNDQWISAAGTSWAAMALTMAAPPRQVTSNMSGR